MTAFALHLPTASAGFAALTAGARASGRRAAAQAAAALGEQLGLPVTLEARALPAPADGPAPGMARLGLSLAALPAPAVLEVEASLAARLVDLLAGGEGRDLAALSLTPVECSALELLALVAVSGAAEVPAAAGLAPFLAGTAEEPRGALAVEVVLAAGAVRGRCRLLLPPEALRRLDEPGELPEAVAAWTLDGWLSSGAARLSPGELASLEPGDVLVLDAPPSDAACLHLPGLRLRGRLEEERFVPEGRTVDPIAADLSLELTVEIARVSLTLGDLAGLEPGGALPLHAPRDGRVVLRLGERAVARGQLIEIDGALGVRIDRLEERP